MKPLVSVFQEVKKFYEDYQQMKQQQREEAEAEHEAVTSKHIYIFSLQAAVVSHRLNVLSKCINCSWTHHLITFSIMNLCLWLNFHLLSTFASSGERRPKVKKPKEPKEFPVYKPSSENLNYQSYDQTSSIEEIEDQVDVWLQDSRGTRKKVWCYWLLIG